MPEAANVHNLLLILAKDLASRLATPGFVVDREGTLLYYNEAAESALGRPYAETGRMRADEWAKLFEPTRDDGSLVPLDELPTAIVLTRHEPSHQAFTIRTAEGEHRKVAVTALPLFAHADELVGALAVFWEDSGS